MYIIVINIIRTDSTVNSSQSKMFLFLLRYFIYFIPYVTVNIVSK